MNELSRIIAAEIGLNGPISMARFMELALYCPDYGYYEQRSDSIGRNGDFQTGVSVGPTFGGLLAGQCARWLDLLRDEGGHAGFCLVEAGAHDGQLALDILGWLQRERPDLVERLQYILLEASEARRSWQQTKLQRFRARLEWHSGFEEIQKYRGGVCGVILTNEFLDALPVHRFAWDRRQQRWFEWRIKERNGRFVWSRGGTPDPSHATQLERLVPNDLRQVLPDGYIIDHSPAALIWWKTAAQTLKKGWLMTFDYGLCARTAMIPERCNGTLRGYRRHRATADVLSRPGEQDITAHVHFDAIRECGEEWGCRTEYYGSQGPYFVRLLEDLRARNYSSQALSPSFIRQFKTLIHPEHFGQRFKVLIQSKL